MKVARLTLAEVLRPIRPREQDWRMERPPAKPPSVELCSERYVELDSLLAERLYEFNSQATGIFDGELLAGAVEDPSGTVIGGFSGHTWGGYCELKQLWVHQAHRGRGLGSALMRAVEAEAQRRGCTRVLLTTHDFQAPAFYERLGYRRHAVIDDYPRGHSQFVYIKQLAS